MSIPIVIINRDRYQSTKKLVSDLLRLGYSYIIIMDMKSTYQPLRDWYWGLSDDVSVVPFNNTGHKTLWEEGYIQSAFKDYPWVAVTDSDIALHPNTPIGFIEDMITVAKDFRVDKVGLAIDYKDISNNHLKNIIEPIESRYWNDRLIHKTHQCYNAPVDTTFCIVRPDKPFQYNAVRVADWPIHHNDWYSDWGNLTEEEKYYFDNADERISTTKAHYLEWKRNH